MEAKHWVIVGAVLALLGSLLFFSVMTALEWDFTKLSTVKYVTNTYEPEAAFKDISIVTDTAQVDLIPSANHKVSVVCYEQENVKHSVAVKDNALVIKAEDTRQWYEHIGIYSGTPKISVYVPQGEYGVLSVKFKTGDLSIPRELCFESIDAAGSTGAVTCNASAAESIKIKTTTGKIYIEDITAGSVSLSVSTGKVTAANINCSGALSVKVSTGKAVLTNVDCKRLESDGSTGSISLKNVIASEAFYVERSTGNVKLDGCDAGELYIKTDTGDITGSLLTDKVFITQTDTGKIQVPKTTFGGKCEITTDTGDIEITVG